MPSQRRASAAPADAESSSGAVRVLKKYPNRRLYDTRTSSYITLADVKEMVLAGEVFEVRDAKTSEDLTRSILLQIILEEESAGVPLFSAQTLSQIIRFYGHATQGVMGSLLEKNMAAFADFQQQLMAPAKGLYDPKALNADVWGQFMAGQGQAMQKLMDGYLEQSRGMLETLQQAGTMFPGFPSAKK